MSNGMKYYFMHHFYCVQCCLLLLKHFRLQIISWSKYDTWFLQSFASGPKKLLISKDVLNLHQNKLRTHETNSPKKK
ncbi:unnamed protein product, partial [Larinioides sclopetarius]